MYLFLLQKKLDMLPYSHYLTKCTGLPDAGAKASHCVQSRIFQSVSIESNICVLTAKELGKQLHRFVSPKSTDTTHIYYRYCHLSILASKHLQKFQSSMKTMTKNIYVLQKTTKNKTSSFSQYLINFTVSLYL